MKKMLMLIMVLVLCLTGCSSNIGPTDNVTFKFKDGLITYNGSPVTFTEYHGYRAIVEGGTGGLTYELMLEAGNDVTSISVNTQSVLEENMDNYKGKFYYTEYLGTKFTMADQVTKDYFEICQTYGDGLDPGLTATYCAKYIDDIPLTDGQIKVDCGDFIVGNDYDQFIVRPDHVVIQSMLKVSVGTYNTSETVTVVQNNKEYQLQKGSTAKYDYYVYGDYLIQLAAGLDISSYITFK